MLVVTLTLPTLTYAATPHLNGKATVKKALACQKTVQGTGATFVDLRRIRLAGCANTMLACETGDQACREKAQKSKHVGVKLAKCDEKHLQCSARSRAVCAATVEQLLNGENFFDVSIRGIKSCGALDFTDLKSAAGLGFDVLADSCRRVGLTVNRIEELSQCIVQHFACQADKIVDAEIPRVRELLRTAGVSADALNLLTPCLEDHAGQGEILPTSARSRTVNDCDARFDKSSKKFTATAFAATGVCLNEIMKCVQANPDEPKCLESARTKCHKAVARLAAKGDAFEDDSPGGACTNAFADLTAPAGGNRGALSCSCTLGGVPDVSNLAEAAKCARRIDECRLAKLLPIAVPRAAELLQLVDLTPSDLLCAFDGSIPHSRLPGRTFGRALSTRARPTVPTIRNLLTGTGTSTGKSGSFQTGTKLGTGANRANAVAVRPRVLPDSSGRLVARYAKRQGVSLTVIGYLRDGTPFDDGFLLDGFFDAPDDDVTDEVDESETHLILNYPPALTTCAYELGVMIDDDTDVSKPVRLDQGAVVDSTLKLLSLQQVEEEDVPDTKDGPQVHGLEGDRWIVASPDGKYVYAAGASNNVGFCHVPVDPTLPFCMRDSDCGAGGPCLLDKPRMTSDALVSFARDGTGRLHFQQTVSFGPEATEAELRIQPDANPLGIAVSPDNANVYVALERSQTIIVLTRDVNGNLTFKQKIVGGDVNHPPQMQDARAVLVSPDGQNVYVAAGALFLHDPPPNVNTRGGVVVFSRSPATGELSFLESKVNATDDIPAQALAGATALAMSPDGKTLYVAALLDSAVTALQRDEQTGALTFVETRRNLVDGVSGILNARDVTVSPDGKFVYVDSFNDFSVVTFARNTTTGGLTFLGRTTNGAVGDDPSHPLTDFKPTRALVSPDGSHLYVAGGTGLNTPDAARPDATVTVFSRDPASGALSYLYDAGGNNLSAGVCVAVSPDSKSLYSTTQLHASVGFYSIAPPAP